MLFDAIRRRRQEKADSQQAWLARWQSLVPEQCRNVPVTVDGRTMIAYIQCNVVFLHVEKGTLDSTDKTVQGGNTHNFTWQYAYAIPELIEWVRDQSL